MRAGLSLEQAPPLSVPTRFFLTAPGFAVLAGGAFVWLGAEAVSSRWAPPTIGITHLVTLGFVTTVAFGALLQMLPVLSGVAAPRPRLVARVVHPLLVSGTLGLSGGFLFASPPLLRAGGALLGLALVAFLLTMAAVFRRVGARPNPTLGGMRLALIGLAIATLFGLSRAAGHAWGTSVPFAFTGVHLAWALFGWVGLLIVAVAFQVVPMFQITPDYPRPVSRWLPGALFLVLGLWSGAVLLGWPEPARLLETLLIAGFGAFAVVTLHLQRRRRRRIADAFLGFWRLGMGALLGAGVVRLWASWGAPSWNAETVFGVLVIVGAVQSVMIAMLYKIVPFLVWLHSRERPGGAQNMNQVLPERRMRHQLWLHALALAGLAAASLLPPLAPFAGFVYAASCAFLGFNLIHAARASSASAHGM